MSTIATGGNLYTVNVPAKNAKTKEVFLDAGISAIYDKGVDHLSVSMITQLAKSTRPTFYSLFGDIDGLLADIWLTHGNWFLENLANADFRFEVADALTKEKITALLEIFTVSHRKLEVFEVVQPQTKKWWDSHTANNDYIKLKLAWLAGLRLGSWLTYPIEPKALLATFAQSYILGLGDKAGSTALELRQIKLPRLSEPKIGNESVDDLLIESAIKVISRVGVPSASMTRISRNAEVTTGSAYPRFKNLEVLLLASFDRAITKVTAENFSQISPQGFSPDDFGNITTAGLQDDRKIWRNFRVEVHLEGRVNNKLAKVIRVSLEKINTRVADGLGLLPISKPERESVAFLVHVIGVGLAMLLNAGLAVEKLDHRLITRDMIAALANK